MTGPTITRTMVLWCPDWPVMTAIQAHSLAPDAPIALIEKGRVFACSASARSEGVKRGLRLREAQARVPELLVHPYESVLDHRAFEVVVDAIEEIMPGVQLLRPGMCAIRMRGPSRYYGGEEQAARALLACLDELGFGESRVGVADGPFTAEHAARSTALSSPGPRSLSLSKGADLDSDLDPDPGPGPGPDPDPGPRPDPDAQGYYIRIVPRGESAAFLGPLGVGLLDSPQLVTLLYRLGVHTLADFAALPADDVLGRFGEEGARLHALASGLDSRAVVPRVPPEQLDAAIEFEPALDRVDQVTFAFRASADRFIEVLTDAKLVCTAIRIEVASESGETSERSWLHPRSFTASDVLDRVRWQLQGGGAIDSGLRSGIARVRVVPESVDAIGNHEEGLWGTGPDERIHSGLSRVQSMLGHGEVLTAVIGGGRSLTDRSNLVAWGDRPQLAKSAQQPWPGQLPPLPPATVFASPHPVQVVDAHAVAVDVDDRGVLTAPPARFSAAGSGGVAGARAAGAGVPDAAGDARTVTAWAGPWPVNERWWDADQSRRANRFQVVDSQGTAWLLVLEDGQWRAEARYD